MTPEEALALLKEKEQTQTMKAWEPARLKQAIKILAGSWAKNQQE